MKVGLLITREEVKKEREEENMQLEAEEAKGRDAGARSSDSLLQTLFT